MLRLLIRTRLRYYRHFVRYNFNRRTLLEIGLTALLVFMLIGRFPSDLPYLLPDVFSAEFSAAYTAFFMKMVLVFYWTVETAALATLRPTCEIQLLTPLPFSQRDIRGYHVARHALKTAFLLILLAILFLGGSGGFLAHGGRLMAGIGILIIIQQLGFIQAYTLRRWLSVRHESGMLLRWVAIEGGLVLVWLFFHEAATEFLMTRPTILLSSWLLVGGLFFVIRHEFPGKPIAHRSKKPGPTQSSARIRFKTRGLMTAFLQRDWLLIWRTRRNLIWLQILSFLGMVMVALLAPQRDASLLTNVGIFVVVSLIVVNHLGVLFDDDAANFHLLQTLPLKARHIWLGRWLFAGLFIGLPFFPPLALTFVRFGFDEDMGQVLFFFGLGFPALMAAFYCSTGFGMISNPRLGRILLNTAFFLMIAFWVFIPFGSLFILIVLSMWIHKSLRNLRYLELI